MEEIREEQREQTQEEINEQARVRRQKLAELQAAGNDPYEITKYDVTMQLQAAREAFEASEGNAPEGSVSLRAAGRMMSRRIMGKASFLDLRDVSGRMQVYVKRDEVGEEAYNAFKKWDIGDILGIEGYVFRTLK